jgi:predicted PurR-regulated permease PerM
VLALPLWVLCLRRLISGVARRFCCILLLTAAVLLLLLLLLQFVEELGKLQDRVPAFSADKAEAIIERDLGQPVSKVRRNVISLIVLLSTLACIWRLADKAEAIMKSDLGWSVSKVCCQIHLRHLYNRCFQRQHLFVCWCVN